MIRRLLIGGLVALLPSIAAAQPTSAPPYRASAVVLDMVTGVERALTGVAEEMPAAKYDFVPIDGNFRGVRTFARQIKHAAAVQHLAAATILGERVTADMADERGPDSVRTKAEVLEYLKGSFAALKRAVATIDETNVFEPFKGPFGPASQTRLGTVAVAVSTPGTTTDSRAVPEDERPRPAEDAVTVSPRAGVVVCEDPMLVGSISRE